MDFRFRPVFGMVLVLGSAIALTQCGGASSPTAPVTTVEVPVPIAVTPPSTSVPVEVPIAPPVIPSPGSGSTSVNILGDTGWCGSPAMAPIARLFDRFDGDIILAGDLAYPNGSQDDFRNCFEPSFGRFKSRMRASPGNHEYMASASAEPYFTYFGDRSGPSRLGFYSFRAAEWTVLMLNSSMPIGRNSPQLAFVRQVMQQTPTRCTMAVLHHPFDSSSLNGPTPSLRDLWELMYNLGGDLVINGHDHVYERHSPVNPDQRRDDARGIRQFTVGTGGATLYGRMRTAINSELLISSYGILRLKLDPALYEWQFMDVDGHVVDSGLNVCH
jgi:acid phosphatase type 7